MSLAALLSSFSRGQAAGLACRVSCATPVLGPALGMVGVGAASAMAGQASLLCRQEMERRSSGTGPRPAPPPLLRRKDLVLDALLGVVLFKARRLCCWSLCCSLRRSPARRASLSSRHAGSAWACCGSGHTCVGRVPFELAVQQPVLGGGSKRVTPAVLVVLVGLSAQPLPQSLGGRFRSLLPSDLFWPGAMAMESLPAPSAQYAASEHRGELYRLFRRRGPALRQGLGFLGSTAASCTACSAGAAPRCARPPPSTPASVLQQAALWQSMLHFLICAASATLLTAHLEAILHAMGAWVHA